MTSATDVSFLLLLIEVMGVHVTVAALLAAGAGAAAKFLLSKTWVFRDATRIHVGQLARYLGMVGGSVLLVSAAMHTFAVLCGLPYLFAKCLSGLCVFLAWSYPVQARYVFARRCQ